ncbi:esterase [Herbidospora sp. NBRC 101105]|nr:esterase [Herbidospora sp. NBRC 101105]
MIPGAAAGRMAAMDPELEPFVPLIPRPDYADPVAERATTARLVASLPAPDTSAMRVTDRLVAAVPDVPVRIYRPQEARGAIVWLHGGGGIVGDLDTEHPSAARLAEASGAMVVSVGFRLAPEHVFPAALDDAYAVLCWLADSADELGVDPGRIAVGGMSAGGGLAAAMTLRARDEDGPPIRCQLLNQPMLDDRRHTWSARAFTRTPRLDAENLAVIWGANLGATPATPYAAPARATDLSNLPPAYIATAEFDPLRDEGIAYAVRLLQSGVSVELHQWPGTFHGSQAILSAQVSQRQNAELAAALRRALETSGPPG